KPQPPRTPTKQQSETPPTRLTRAARTVTATVPWVWGGRRGRDWGCECRLGGDLGAEGLQGLGDRLEEGDAADAAVARAAGGEAEGGGPREERAAAVARLRADGRLDHAGDRAFGEVHRGVGGEDAAGGDARGAAAAHHLLSHDGVAGLGDAPGPAVVEVDGARARLRRPDEREVVPGEAARHRGAEELGAPLVRGPVPDGVPAVPRREEEVLPAALDVEAERAAGALPEDRVAAERER